METKMKKVLPSVAAVLVLAATANAQGTWYTNYFSWVSQMNSIGGVAGYDALPNYGSVSNPYTESGVTTSVGSSYSLWGLKFGSNGALSTANPEAISLTFNGNAFGGYFGTTDLPGNIVSDGMNFSIDGSLTNVYSMTSSTAGTGFSFLGYISDSAGAINLTFSPDSSPSFVTIDSFAFGNGSNATNPGCAVPEPGTYVSMGLFGAGVLGLVVRSRRRTSN